MSGFLGLYSRKLCRLADTVEDGDFFRAVEIIAALKNSSNKILMIGNGGSAAICSHLAVDFTKSCGIRAMCFSDCALQTCFSNDYGYENAYAEMIEAYGALGDVVIAISSSGSSVNILNAVEASRIKGLEVITLSGFANDNPLRSKGSINFYIDCCEYNLVENLHEQILLALCDNLRMGSLAFEDWVSE
jgi:D-sedoheptulose 7-phosphate isomerase